MQTSHPMTQKSLHGPLLRTVLLILMLAGVTSASCDRRSEEISSEDSIHTERPAPAQVPGPAGGGVSTPAEGVSGIAPHQHDPEHGGTVRSVDVYHVEVVPAPVQVWLYDRRGNPLQMDDVSGKIVIYSEDERRPVELRLMGEYFSPVEAITFPQEGIAFVELMIGKHSIDVAFELPLES